jgi:toxin ParE1/3/4
MKYEFHPAAEAEHLENVGYYELKRAGLGVTYLSDFETIMNNICGFPSRFPVERKPDICRSKMAKFPFTILFRESSGMIQILAVAHLRRRPLYWLGRL